MSTLPELAQADELDRMISKGNNMDFVRSPATVTAAIGGTDACKASKYRPGAQ